MATSPENEVRYIAIGYAAYALMFLGVGSIIFSYVEWPGLQQFIKDLYEIRGTLLLITGGFVINTIMAVGSWKILSLKGWKRRAVLFGAVAMAAVFVLNIAIGIIVWAMRDLPFELENVKFISSLGLAVSYVVLAGLLLRAVLVSSKRSERAQ